MGGVATRACPAHSGSTPSLRRQHAACARQRTQCMRTMHRTHLLQCTVLCTVHGHCSWTLLKKNVHKIDHRDLGRHIGYLPSLERLDLSRNNFITMPASLNRLSRLRSLIIEYCKCLQSLLELPSSIESLNAHSCKSLETFSCSSSAYTLKLLGGVMFNFSNCFRLGEIQGSDVVTASIYRGNPPNVIHTKIYARSSMFLASDCTGQNVFA